MHHLDLKGKVALVTGGSRGIGAAIAEELAAAGAHVALSYRARREQALEVVRAIQQRGGAADAFDADVTRPLEVERMVRDVANRHGQVDIVVNNAGTWVTREFGKIEAEHVAEQFNTHVLGAILVTQAAARHFPASGARVINVSSNLAGSPLTGAVVYSAAKAALNAVTRGFARELGSRNVTVNAVAPGVTATDMTSDLSPEEREAIAVQTPLRRLGEPADIAGVVAFLASSAASWITGHTIYVDGGLVDH